MNKTFSMTSGLRPGRSVFDLSYEKKFTCDMGQLIPILCEEMVPGDFFTIGNQSIIRFQPLVAPILHEINQYVHYFFVPYRLMYEDFEDFISGGISGDLTPTIPRWAPDPLAVPPVTIDTSIGSLWDYMGFPTGIDPKGAYPLDFPRIAYNYVYNEYYRDETLIPEVDLTNETILNRCWEKDYFTSSLPFQQRGTAPALPISGTSAAVWTTGAGDTNVDSLRVGSASHKFDLTFNGFMAAYGAALNNNTVDLSTASTFDIADLRLAFQIQKWMERNARAGARYVEFLKSHFGVSPRDSRLQRPQYIGGSKSSVIISEVLQTSSTDVTSPQGNLAGHGISASSNFCGIYKAEEYGLVIGIMSVMPRSAYQQGINRQWLRRTKYDFYFPEFANLSEQAIENAEICAIDGNATHNVDLFGFQGRYDEMRTKQSMVCGLLRTTYDYWHMGRVFDPATPPELNDDFVICTPRKDIFAVPSEPGLIVSFGNLVKAIRPLPLGAEPGLIDHN